MIHSHTRSGPAAAVVQRLKTIGLTRSLATYAHVHGRSLTPETFGQEVDRTRSELEALAGREVRSFSLPYGSSADLTSGLVVS
jgi:hypothetical protein